jgi:hypothetical protein
MNRSWDGRTGFFVRAQSTLLCVPTEACFPDLPESWSLVGGACATDAAGVSRPARDALTRDCRLAVLIDAPAFGALRVPIEPGPSTPPFPRGFRAPTGMPSLLFLKRLSRMRTFEVSWRRRPFDRRPGSSGLLIALVVRRVDQLPGIPGAGWGKRVAPRGVRLRVGGTASWADLLVNARARGGRAGREARGGLSHGCYS